MHFELFKSEKNGNWYFRCKYDEDKQILRSEGYSSKSGCKNGIEAVKKYGFDHRNFKHKETKDGRPFFNLQSPNGEIIATSVFFQEESDMKNMIAAIRRDAKKAKTKEL